MICSKGKHSCQNMNLNWTKPNISLVYFIRPCIPLFSPISSQHTPRVHWACQTGVSNPHQRMWNMTGGNSAPCNISKRLYITAAMHLHYNTIFFSPKYLQWTLHNSTFTTYGISFTYSESDIWSEEFMIVVSVISLTKNTLYILPNWL